MRQKKIPVSATLPHNEVLDEVSELLLGQLNEMYQRNYRDVAVGAPVRKFTRDLGRLFQRSILVRHPGGLESFNARGVEEEGADNILLRLDEVFLPQLDGVTLNAPVSLAVLLDRLWDQTWLGLIGRALTVYVNKYFSNKKELVEVIPTPSDTVVEITLGDTIEVVTRSAKSNVYLVPESLGEPIQAYLDLPMQTHTTLVFDAEKKEFSVTDTQWPVDPDCLERACKSLLDYFHLKVMLQLPPPPTTPRLFKLMTKKSPLVNPNVQHLVSVLRVLEEYVQRHRDNVLSQKSIVDRGNSKSALNLCEQWLPSYLETDAFFLRVFSKMLGPRFVGSGDLHLPHLRERRGAPKAPYLEKLGLAISKENPAFLQAIIDDLYALYQEFRGLSSELFIDPAKLPVDSSHQTQEMMRGISLQNSWLIPSVINDLASKVMKLYDFIPQKASLELTKEMLSFYSALCGDLMSICVAVKSRQFRYNAMISVFPLKEDFKAEKAQSDRKDVIAVITECNMLLADIASKLRFTYHWDLRRVFSDGLSEKLLFTQQELESPDFKRDLELCNKFNLFKELPFNNDTLGDHSEGDNDNLRVSGEFRAGRLHGVDRATACLMLASTR